MVTILSGSPRKNSNTIRVAKAIAHLLREEYGQQEVSVIDFYGFDIPSANAGEMNPSALSTWQQEVHDAMSASSLVFVLTPEYNWFPSAEIIQFVHSFTSRAYKNMWDNKVIATCGVSNGRGGRMPAVQLSYSLNKIISVFSYQSLISAKMFESQFTDKALDPEGRSLGNEEYMKGLKLYIEYNLAMANRWSQ